MAVKRDYLGKQIDELGRALGKMLAELLGLKNQGETKQGVELTTQALKHQLDLDLESLSAIPSENLITFLQEEKKLSNESLSPLAEILLIIAEDGLNNEPGNQKNKELLKSSLLLFEYLQTNESVYSFDRHIKIQRIKVQLEEIL